ncbi:MAG TPA: type II toxin-antitoxin system VapC family toxin [Gemmatimonadales bacterium]|nr:type II toxin-antitoxin system VapC family toxin [Gemmatimonadales bacterium]
MVPLLVHQSASPVVDSWFAGDPAIVLWTLTPVEITSALWRLVREGGLPEVEALRADTRAQELAAASYAVMELETVQALARRLLRTHSLRAADALQLGASLFWANGRPQGKTLHTLDERLALAARREGFEVPPLAAS